MTAHAPRRSGFSLLEIIIAIGIVGAGLVAAEALVHAVPLARVTRSEDLALTIANNEIGILRAGGYASVPGSGAFNNTLLEALPSGDGTLTVTDWNAEVKQVRVTVSWQEPGEAARSLLLSTLIAETGGLP